MAHPAPTTEQMQRALSMVLAGSSMRTIADELADGSKARASAIVSKAVRDATIRGSDREAVWQARQDALYRALLPIVLDGGPEATKAAAIVARIVAANLAAPAAAAAPKTAAPAAPKTASPLDEIAARRAQLERGAS